MTSRSGPWSSGAVSIASRSVSASQKCRADPHRPRHGARGVRPMTEGPGTDDTGGTARAQERKLSAVTTGGPGPNPPRAQVTVALAAGGGPAACQRPPGRYVTQDGRLRRHGYPSTVPLLISINSAKSECLEPHQQFALESKVQGVITCATSNLRWEWASKHNCYTRESSGLFLALMPFS